MDRNTLSNYGWIIVTTIIIALMIVLATPFGNYIGDAFTSVVDGFSEKVAEGTDEAITVSRMGDKGGSIYHGNETEVFALTSAYASEGDATFIPGDNGAIEAMVANMPQIGDKVIYGDYVYEYKEYVGGISKGWDVSLKDGNTSKSSYPAIAETVLGAPVVSIGSTFYSCTNLVEAPALPDTIENMSGAFYNCSSLTTVAKMPDNAKVIDGAFMNCTSLTGTIIVGSNLTDYLMVFSGTTQPINLYGLTGSSLAAEVAVTANSEGNANITFSYAS